MLMICDRNKITSEQIMSYTNSLHTNLQFNPTHEISNTVNFFGSSHIQEHTSTRYSFTETSPLLQPPHGT
jgi:hypothetical protein